MATSPPRGRHGHATSRPATPRSDGEDEWYDTPPGSSAAAATTAAAADVADADPAAASAAAATVVADAADVELSAADATGDGVPAADATGDGLFAADATGVGLFLADATGGDLPAADTPGGGGGDPPAGGAWSGGSPAADGGAAAGGSSDGGSAAGYASAGDTLGDAPPAGDATGGGLPAGDASGGQAAAGRPPGGGAVAGDAPRRGSAGGYASDGGSSLGDASGSDGVVGVASPVGSSPAVAAFVSDADEPADADAVGDAAVGGDAAASDGSATASAAASVADAGGSDAAASGSDAGGSDAAASVADADASDAAASVADDGGDDAGDAAARGARLGTLTGRLHAMMMDEALCDCVVVVAGRRYPCVRVVLAQGSAFFRAMFFGAHPMAEREAGEATLEGVSRTGWEAVRLWLYTARKIKVRRDTDFSDIITAADRLCVPDLVDATQRDAAASLSADNVVTLANLAWSGLPALKALREATIEYLRAHFEELRTRDDVCCALRLAIFSSLVACPWLRVRDEDTLLMTILYRLSQGTHTKDDVVDLLGSVRLHLLDEDSLWTLSIIARGGTTGPVVATYEALQAGVTAVVLGGLSSMSAAPAGPSRLPLVRSRQRCSVVGRSGMVLWDPRGDQSRRVYSSAFRALGHKWKVDVHTHAKEGSPATLGAYLHLKSARELPVVARAYMWAVCVDSGGYFSPSMVVVAKPGTRILFQQTFTHEWKSMSAQGYPRVVDAATLDALRQDDRDAHVCVGVSITAVDGP